MKKYVLLVALLLMVAIPAVVAAGTDTKIMEVKGDLIRSISVTLVDYTDAPYGATFSFPGFSTGDNEVTPFTATTAPRVKVVVAGGDGTWSVDLSNDNSGKMYAVSSQLADSFYLGADPGYPTHAYYPLTSASPWVSFMTSGTQGTFYDNLYMKQHVATTDPSGNYKITLTFTGSAP